LNKTKRARFGRSELKPEPTLDIHQIVQAALDLLDEVGLDGLTMRPLGERLGIKAASLYWHVHDKRDLFELLAEEICAGMRAPDPALPWREQIELIAHEYRRALLAHRDGARILADAGPPLSPSRLRLVEASLEALLSAGFSQRDAAHAVFMFNDFGTMFVVEETRPPYELEMPDGDQPNDPGQAWIAMLPPEEYPRTMAAAPHLVGDNMDERFAFGLSVLLDGLEARLKQHGSR
jgi:AcrR family transcriptional regulator